MKDDPSQFYTDLVAELYEPLAGDLPDPAPYQRFLDRYGTPALELGCGSGLPMLDLLDLGYEVEGLDASADMLAICRSKAAQRGHTPRLHHGRFQDFDLPGQYRSIYVPSASFTLMTSDQDATQALARIWHHLAPGGALWLPLEVPDGEKLKRGINQVRSAKDALGRTIRVSMTGIELEDNDRNIVMHLRYERVAEDGTVLRVNRDWRRRSWNEVQIQALMRPVGFSDIRILSHQPSGSPRTEFVVLGVKSLI